MSGDKRPVSAIYAGLDTEREATQSEVAADAVSNDSAAPQIGKASSADETSKARSSKGPKIAIAIIALVSIVLIAVSAFTLAGGFSSDGGTSTETTVSAAGEAETDDPDGDQNKEIAAEGDDAGDKADEAESGNASDGGNAPGASSDESSNAGTASSGISVSEGSGSGHKDPAPAEKPSSRITVAVSVDSSSVGSPVSLVTTVQLDRGASVYDALVATGLSINARSSQFGKYVAGIGGLAEKEHGGTSGWTYYVNGVFVNNAASGTVLNDGDAVSWVYVTGD